MSEALAAPFPAAAAAPVAVATASSLIRMEAVTKT